MRRFRHYITLLLQFVLYWYSMQHRPTALNKKGMNKFIKNLIREYCGFKNYPPNIYNFKQFKFRKKKIAMQEIAKLASLD